MDLSTIPKPIEHISEEQWKEIINMLESNEDKTVEIDVAELSKEIRKEIHGSIKKVLGIKIVASTINNDNKKVIELKKYKGG